MAQLQCIVVTPEATVLDESVDFVARCRFMTAKSGSRRVAVP